MYVNMLRDVLDRFNWFQGLWNLLSTPSSSQYIGSYYQYVH